MVRGIKSWSFAGLPALPPPLTLTASITPRDTARAILRLEFEDEAGVEKFLAAWPKFVDAAGDLPIPGLSGMLEAVAWEQEDERLYGDAEVNGMLIKLILAFASSALPKAEL